MAISDNFIEELLKYDYTSKKKGRGNRSILISKIGKAQTQKRRKSNVSED